MKLPVVVNIKSESIEYHLELRHKITILTGYSGVGKSVISNILLESSDYKDVYVSAKGYTCMPIQGLSWAQMLLEFVNGSNTGSGRYIFIFDDVDFFLKKEFAEQFKKDAHNLYLIINRLQSIKESSLASIPFSMDGIYNLCTDGNRHWMEPKYNFDNDGLCKYDCIITEDGGNGLSFLRSYNPNISTSKGKSGIVSLLLRNANLLKGKNVLIFADLAGIGSTVKNLTDIASVCDFNISLVENYQCFEYLLLTSAFLKDKVSKSKILDRANTLEEIVKYRSGEHMYECLLSELTNDTRYYQSHSSRARISRCYTKDCCSYEKDRESCDNILIGDKQSLMFKGTEWEDLFNSIKSSVLLKIV